MRWAITIIVPMALVAVAPTMAQRQSPVAVGATVYDLDGDEVGTILSIEGDAAILSTGTTLVTLGLTSFRLHSGRLTIGLTRGQLEEGAQAVQTRGDEEVRAQLTPGANIYDRDGAVAATVESVEGARVTIVAGTIRAVFPLSAFRADARGPQISRTAQEFQNDLSARSNTPGNP
jgi:hypothetical protein